MRLFKPTYTDRSGKKKKAQKWYLDFFTADGIRHKLPLFTDKRACEAVKNTIAECISHRASKTAFSPDLQRKIDCLPARILSKLNAWGLLDSARIEGAKPLEKHLTDFEKYLLAKGNTKMHVAIVVARARRVLEGCAFYNFSDISANKVLSFLTRLRNNGEGISAQTYNFYLQAIKEFCRWMVQNQRASESPLQHLKGLNVKTDRRHDRRALKPDELRRLLEATAAAERRFGMSGYERALLYRLAVETGLRAKELRSLKASSFDFDRCTVTVQAAYSKHRRTDTVPLRKDTAQQLKQHLANKLPQAKAFNIPQKTAKMFRADLAEADIPYVDEAGRYADFHSLRHTTGSLLAASGAHPKVAQSIMRHCDINLTMSRYTHIFTGQQSEAVEKLPVLPLPGSQRQAAVRTGTDGQIVLDNCLDSSLDKQGGFQRTDLDCAGQENGTAAEKTAFSEANGRTRTGNRWFTKPETENHKPLPNKELTKSKKAVFDSSLDKIAQNHPDLTPVIERWPSLPEYIKKAVIALVRTACLSADR